MPKSLSIKIIKLHCSLLSVLTIQGTLIQLIVIISLRKTVTKRCFNRSSVFSSKPYNLKLIFFSLQGDSHALQEQSQGGKLQEMSQRVKQAFEGLGMRHKTLSFSLACFAPTLTLLTDDFVCTTNDESLLASCQIYNTFQCMIN